MMTPFSRVLDLVYLFEISSCNQSRTIAPGPPLQGAPVMKFICFK